MINVPNFVTIGQTVAEIAILFNMAAVRHLEFVLRVLEHARRVFGGFLSFCKSWLKWMHSFRL